MEEGYLRRNMAMEQRECFDSEARTKRGDTLMHAVEPNVVLRLNMEVHLEDAMDIAETGRYQLFHWALMLLMLLAAMLEMIGIAFVLPAAACDLDVPDNLKGIITSIPNIGVILTAPLWGRAADHWGRKPVLLITSALAGALGLAATLMPNLVTFAVCKLAASMFLSCPSSLTIAYACELMPRRRRDWSVLLANGLLMLLSTLNPIFAWAVLSTEWRFALGSLELRPWRLLTAVYAAPLLLTVLWLTGSDESPKFLMTKGREQDALDVLRKVYVYNTGKSADSFGVKSLKHVSECPLEQDGSDCELTPKASRSAWALLQPPHLKWFALTSFLMFGLFSLLNGLFLMAPDTINKVMSGAEAEEGTVCALINLPDNTTAQAAQPPASCTDSISTSTFHIMTVTTAVYGLLVTAVSVSSLAKRTQLLAMYAAVSTACLVAGLTTNRVLAGVAMSALQVTALGIGPLTAYAVQLFPTSLRGTAVGAVMMFGRVGSATGANAAGYFLAAACGPTFYGFTLLTTVCAALSLLLPKDRPPVSSAAAVEYDSR